MTWPFKRDAMNPGCAVLPKKTGILQKYPGRREYFVPTVQRSTPPFMDLVLCTRTVTLHLRPVLLSAVTFQTRFLPRRDRFRNTSTHRKHLARLFPSFPIWISKCRWMEFYSPPFSVGFESFRRMQINGKFYKKKVEPWPGLNRQYCGLHLKMVNSYKIKSTDRRRVVSWKRVRRRCRVEHPGLPWCRRVARSRSLRERWGIPCTARPGCSLNWIQRQSRDEYLVLQLVLSTTLKGHCWMS